MKRNLLLLTLVAAPLGALLYGNYAWNAGTRDLRMRLDKARLPVTPRVVNFRELEGLPSPVQRYFRLVLRDGQAIVTGVRVRHTGTFNMGQATDQWRPFTSDQQVVTRRPGFDWDGRVRMFPGVAAHVHDAYVAGEGILSVSALGLVPIINLRGSGAIAEGELMRFFAEAAWYPTALLPSQGVHWEAGDASSATATLTDGASTLSMRFTFSDEGLIDTVWAAARGRTVDETIVPTPWYGRFWNYVERDGMRIPLDGEVAWVLPEGPKPYWRGTITDLHYSFAL